MLDFALHPRLDADTIYVADWALSRLLLMDDARYPWLVLVPRRPGMSELHDLPPPDRKELIEEISRAAAGLKKFASAAKINVGALGNLVPQLHVHVVARRPDDLTWPGPVWGRGQAEPYAAPAREALVARLRSEL